MTSRWDCLPPEIQTYILDLRLRQERLDMVTDRQKELCEMIRIYHRVKREWDLGHVRCQPFRCHICNGINWKDGRVNSDFIYHEKVFVYYNGRSVLVGNCLQQVYLHEIKQNLTLFFS